MKSDLSNLDELLLNSKTMSQDLAQIGKKMAEFNQNLSKESKAVCDSGQTDLIARCTSGQISINDPAQRLCTLVKASLAGYEGALPNIVVSEIMLRAQKKHDEIFSKVLRFEHPTLNNLRDTCSDTGGRLFKRKENLSETASCLFGGKFCTDNDSQVREHAKASGRAQEVCRVNEVWPDIKTGKISKANNTPGLLTQNNGFAGAIEQIIRKEVCGQSKTSDPNKCDQIEIPSKP